MFSATVLVALALFTRSAQAGTKIWDGSFNNYPSVATFDNWSWANQVGQYQWYIHGTQPTSHYLALSPSYKNPANTAETNGLKMTIDSTATWNSQMERAELIPQTTANLGNGTLFYHFSLMRSTTNPPDFTLEHQIMFFESHFTELKTGVSPTPTDLQWHVGGTRRWGTPFTAGTWFNFAYEINFSASTVGLWASTGSAPLTKVIENLSASTSTNSADFHVGVLRIVNTPAPEDWYMSSVYIENGPITTSVGTGGGGVTSAPTSSSTIVSSSTSQTATATSTATGPTQSQWGQCGGQGWAGPTTCSGTFKCVAVSPPFYYQCQ